jgi:hypothetical protein
VPETEILSIEALEEAGPNDWRALRALLRANLPRATWRIAPLQLQLELVHRWLDDQYGEGAWSYESNHTLTKIITTSDGNAMPFRLFRFRETSRGDALVLLVVDDAVERLPITFD